MINHVKFMKSLELIGSNEVQLILLQDQKTYSATQRSCKLYSVQPSYARTGLDSDWPL